MGIKRLLCLGSICFVATMAVMCSSPNDSSGGSGLVGKWIIQRSVESGVTHNYSLDSADQLLEITADSLIWHYRGPYSTTRTAFSYKTGRGTGRGMLVINTGTGFDTVSCRFENRLLVVDDAQNGREYYFAAYSGAIPPASWPPVSGSNVTADSYEVDNTYTAAKPITVNAIAQSHTLTSGDYDYLRFAAVSGTNYTIQTYGSIDTYVRLYGPSGTTPLDSNDDDGIGNNGLIYWTCTTSGAYYVSVRGYGGATGSYTVDVTSGTSSVDIYEPDNTYTTATAISVNGSTQSHTLTTGDYDYLSFSMVSGTTYSIQTYGITDTYISLYDPSGTTLLAFSNDVVGSNGQIVWTCTMSGTYYVSVRGYSGATGSYTVGVTSVTSIADTYEPDSTYSAATAIIVNATAQSHTLTAGDYDYLSFSAVSGVAYTIQTYGTTDTYVSLYGPSGTTPLDSNDDANGSINRNGRIVWTCTTSGTYYVSVRGYSTATTGSYTVDVASSGGTVSADLYEPDNTYTAASSITVNGSTQSHTLTAGDYDYLSFYMVSGTTYTIQTYGTTDTYVSLYDPSGTTLLAYSNDVVGSNGRIVWTCTTSGTYYVSVRGYSTATTGSYTVDVAYSGGTVSADLYEPDNTYTAATAISVNASAQSHTLTAGDYDYLGFYMVSGATYTIQTYGTTDTFVSLYDSSGTTRLAYSDDAATNVNGRIVWTCTTSGTYYVSVRGYSTSTSGSYTVDVVTASMSRIAMPDGGLAMKQQVFSK